VNGEMGKDWFYKGVELKNKNINDCFETMKLRKTGKRKKIKKQNGSQSQVYPVCL
jgi:hypothetical protein